MSGKDIPTNANPDAVTKGRASREVSVITLRNGTVVRIAEVERTKPMARVFSKKTTTCATCGVTVATTGSTQRFCSARCREEFHRTRQRERASLARAANTGWTSVCPNCGLKFTQQHPRAVYCGPECSGEADLVRYFRRKVREYGEDLPSDIHEAIATKFAHVLGGGYDKSGRQLSPATRRLIWERDGGKCVLCSKPGEEIDHINGSNNDPSNLRLLCRDCHHSITRSRMRPIDPDDAETREHREQLLIRVYAPEPLAPSDGEDWEDQWRAWLVEHRRPPSEGNPPRA